MKYEVRHIDLIKNNSIADKERERRKNFISIYFKSNCGDY